jgi:hypothetical protein
MKSQNDDWLIGLWFVSSFLCVFESSDTDSWRVRDAFVLWFIIAMLNLGHAGFIAMRGALADWRRARSAGARGRAGYANSDTAEGAVRS